MYTDKELREVHIKPHAYINASESGLNIEIIPAPEEHPHWGPTIKVYVPGSFSQEDILWAGVQSWEIIEEGYRMSGGEALGGKVGEDLQLSFSIVEA